MLKSVKTYSALGGTSQITLHNSNDLQVGDTIEFQGDTLAITSSMMSGPNRVYTLDGEFSVVPEANDKVTVTAAGAITVDKKFLHKNEGVEQGSPSDLRATSIRVLPGGSVDVGGARIGNVDTGIESTDAVNVGQLQSYVSGALSASDSADDSAFESLSNRVSTEESTRASADSSLATRLSSEESARASGDSSLASRVSTEESVRASADTSLEARVSSEESARASGDSSLASRVSTEESARASADSSLESRVSAEESNRTSGDSSLASRLSTEESARA
ncbi:hypothetical protein EBU71_11125, partial [bacterium]|nr:hypothetical protein [Candidatus Elulimicrobium humile]